jgi:hypothetical protein
MGLGHGLTRQVSVTILYQPEAQRIGRSKRMDEEGAWESLSCGTKRASRWGTPSGARRPDDRHRSA